MCEVNKVYISFKHGLNNLDIFFITDATRERGPNGYYYYSGKSIMLNLSKLDTVSTLKWQKDMILESHLDSSILLCDFVKQFSKLVPEVRKLLIFDKLDKI